MKTFLEYVAEDVIQKYGYNLSRIAVVFPNKRASLFFNEYLVRISGKPLWSPAYITISDLFRSHTHLQVGDPIKLICDLHKCFCRNTNSAETLDHFYGWGQLLLSDFDDIDKNMANASKVFANLRDIHEYDDISYLDPEQIELLKKFFSTFSADHTTELKERFLNLWSHFYDIYADYNKMLFEQGIAYEGALYREVATNPTLTFEYDTYLFIGFNMLQKVEQHLFERLQKQDKARFYWDFDHYYMPHESFSHEAGHYIASYLELFPNELDIRSKDIYGNFSREKRINFISAPTENIQARYISKWLRENNRIDCGRKTAVVMCNETLLQPIIHSIPNEVDSINVTTGYPLSQSPIASLLYKLIELQTKGYVPRTGMFRKRYREAVLRHPYMAYIPEHNLIFDTLKSDEDLQITCRIVSWMTKIVKCIAVNAHENKDQLFNESVYRAYTLLNRLSGLISSGDLVIDLNTLQRLLAQVVQSTTIPFHGEPAIGIQIMGVLETRNIDFDHILLLSCNEGNMPKGVNDTSFIPYTIRKAYNLTTIDNKVSIYAYYFHRLLQRAGDITIVYNNSTSDTNTGEMSRFMLQLLVESNHRINKLTLQSGQTPVIRNRIPIEKTPEMMQSLRRIYDKNLCTENVSRPLLTPTAVNRFMRCQLQFFYNYICGLREPNEVDEELIDNRVFGNIFHDASQRIYELLMQRSNRILAGDIQRLLDSKIDIELAVDDIFREQLKNANKNITSPADYNGLQLINREVIIRYLRRLLKIDLRLAPFEILGLETDVYDDWEIRMGNDTFTTTLGGRIDRLDCVNDGEGEYIRVVDYKTGSRRTGSLPNVEAIFEPANISKHSDYYLQTFLYSVLVSRNKQRSLPVSPALLYIQHAGGEDYDPRLCFGKECITDIRNDEEIFVSMLKDKINEIFDASRPFIPTNDDAICATCPYAQICGI